MFIKKQEREATAIVMEILTARMLAAETRVAELQAKLDSLPRYEPASENALVGMYL